jgi:Na+-transporting NADH:ubiquinone oxidoreductase subunit NqrB
VEKIGSWFTDRRDYQIAFLSLFFILGIAVRDWSIKPELVAAIFIACGLTQAICQLLLKPNENLLHSLKSSAITSLGLSLLLRSESVTTMALAGCLAIGSKFLFQWQNKHFFNPANFGIIAALVLTKDAWVSPGQWGNDVIFFMLFLGTGAVILKKVGRWDTSATFLLAYAGLETARNLWLGWTWDVLFHRLSSGSLLLFALFMITDPRAIPNAKAGRIVWSIAIAITTFVLRNYFFINEAAFIALFLLSPATILCDRLWQAKEFTWQPKSVRSGRKIELDSGIISM